MLYYKIKPVYIPLIQFACSASADRYRNQFDHKGNLEITTIEGAGVELIFNGTTYAVPPRSVLVFMPNTVCTLRGPEGRRVFDDTIAMDPGPLEYTLLNSQTAGEGDRSDTESILLPMILSPGDEYANITRLIRSFISCYMRESVSASCKCLALWFELIGCLNSLCRQELSGTRPESGLPSSQMYVRKARSYIDKHYSRHLRITDVAEELQITPNYLSFMFKQITGKTVLDYIHLTRIQAVKEMLQQPKPLPITEIAAKTGFGNTRNLCTLFKKINGVGIKEYCRINRELTLYHEKPWEENEHGKENQ